MIIQTPDEYIDRIKSETRNFFKMATFKINKIEVVNKDDVLTVSVQIDNPKTLIGERGQTLLEIQYILRILIRKKIEKEIFIELDINNYKQKKNEMLNDIAKEIADEVFFYKKEKVLPPMNPYERRIIHIALKDRKNIKTESIGEGADRKVVIKPILKM